MDLDTEDTDMNADMCLSVRIYTHMVQMYTRCWQSCGSNQSKSKDIRKTGLGRLLYIEELSLLQLGKWKQSSEKGNKKTMQVSGRNSFLISRKSKGLLQDG